MGEGKGRGTGSDMEEGRRKAQKARRMNRNAQLLEVGGILTGQCLIQLSSDRLPPAVDENRCREPQSGIMWEII